MAVYGPPNNEELYHWKYTRKYKKNGKWRYVYPNDKLGLKEKISVATGSAQKQHEIENAASERAQQNNINKLENKYNEAEKELQKASSAESSSRAANSKEQKRAIHDPSSLNKAVSAAKKRQLDAATKNKQKAEHNYVKAQSNLDSAKATAKAISKRNASGIPKSTVEKGKAAVSKLTNKLKRAANMVKADLGGHTTTIEVYGRDETTTIKDGKKTYKKNKK